MKVFLSWSGQTSHAIAERLHKWLPMVIQKIEPYISTEIEKGTRWSTDIAQELEQCSFGIACVTNENREAPWLLFEAGALSKSVSEGKLAPLLFGLEQSDIQKSPLTQFQMTKFEKGEFLKLLNAINESLEAPLDGSILSNLFTALWPDLEKDISTILKSVDQKPDPVKSSIDPDKIMGAMEELLTNSRAVSQVISRPDKILPQDYIEFIFKDYMQEMRSRPRMNLRRYSMIIDEANMLLSSAGSELTDKQRASIDRVRMMLDELRHRLHNEERFLPRSRRIMAPEKLTHEERASSTDGSEFKDY